MHVSFLKCYNKRRLTVLLPPPPPPPTHLLHLQSKQPRPLSINGNQQLKTTKRTHRLSLTKKLQKRPHLLLMYCTTASLVSISMQQ